MTFDPAEIGYAEILEIFFAIHDPTTLNRQGADVGTQSRSAIFYESEAQRDTARAVIAALAAEGAAGGAAFFSPFGRTRTLTLAPPLLPLLNCSPPMAC